MLRSFHFTPLFAGCPRPPWSWFKNKKHRKEFVLYYATLLIPWGLDYRKEELPSDLQKYGPANEYLNPSKFSRIMDAWSGASGIVPGLLRARYYTFHNIVHNMNAPYRSRLTSIKWRSRAADKWCDLASDKVPRPYKDELNNCDSAGYDPDALEASDVAMNELRMLTEKSHDRTSDMLKHHKKYLGDLGKNFKEAFSEFSQHHDLSKEDKDRYKPQKIAFEDWSKFDLKWAENRYKEILSPKNDESNVSENPLSGQNACEVDLNILNSDQRKAYDTALKSSKNGKQLLLLICGVPGTGKTFTADVIIKSFESKGSYSYACSFMWTAVFKLKVGCEKSSIHDLLCTNVRSSNAKSVASLRDKIWSKLNDMKLKMEGRSMIVIDEVSMTNASLFCMMDTLFRQAFDKDKIFGGKDVILLGDFCQIAPTGEKTLAELLALYQSNKNGGLFSGSDEQSLLNMQAAQVFMNFQRVILNKQMRAAEDPAQCKLLNRFSLKNRDPPITQDVINNFQMLKPDLIRRDACFKDALFAVLSNEERMVIGKLKTIQFGIDHHEPIFCWVQNVHKNELGGDQKRAEEWVQVGAMELEFYFVRGMPMVVCGSGKYGHRD